jgi:hypothetical protein
MSTRQFQRKDAEAQRREGAMNCGSGIENCGFRRYWARRTIESGAKRTHSKTWRSYDRASKSRERPGARALCAAFFGTGAVAVSKAYEGGTR